MNIDKVYEFFCLPGKMIILNFLTVACMKPFKSGKPVANWLLRIALMGTLTVIYYNAVSTLNFSNFNFYLAAIMLLLGVLLFYSAAFSKSSMTIIVGLIIFLVSLYKLMVSFNGSIDGYLITHLVPLSVGFYFFTNGNDA